MSRHLFLIASALMAVLIINTCCILHASGNPHINDNGMTSLSSVYDALKANLPEQTFAQVRRILYGNEWKSIPIPDQVRSSSKLNSFEVRGYSMIHNVAREQTRAPRVVRLGLIQNAIGANTTEPVDVQYKAIEEKIERMINAAALMGVNVVGLQEAWTMPFAFCTREKQVGLNDH